MVLGDKGLSPLSHYKDEQKIEVLSYLKSKLRMVKLLKLKTFPPQRDVVSETVNVLAMPEQIRDQTPKKTSIK